MTEVTKPTPSNPNQYIDFVHPDKGKFTDPELLARIQKEEAYAVLISDAFNAIRDGADSQRLLLRLAKLWADSDDSRIKHAEELDASVEESLTDPLTKGGNKKKFFQDGEGLLRQPGTGLLMLDLDYFKTVNDTIGHEGGDQAIIWFNDLISKSLRKESKGPERDPDRIYRLSGDEHAILVQNTTTTGLTALAERVRKNVAETPFQHEGYNTNLTASIGGVMMKPELGVKGNLQRADLAMYVAKGNGRNAWVIARAA